MKALIIRTLAIFLAGVILLFGLPVSVPVSASTVNIRLTNADDTDATAMSFTNIIPGQSGSQVVKLTNSASESASVYIWVDSIVSTEDTPARFQTGGTGDLVNNLVLRISAASGDPDLVASSFSMPAPITSFPHSASDTNRLSIASLDAGKTVTLTWQWSLPYSTGNENQGDGITFDINYELTNKTTSSSSSAGSGGGGEGGTTAAAAPTGTATASTTTTAAVVTPTQSGSSGGTTDSRIIELVVPSAEDTSGVTSDGIVTGVLQASTPDGDFSLSIEQGTQVQISNENRENPVDLNQVGYTVPWKIEVTNPDASSVPPYPDGWLPVSPNYDINGVTNGYVTGVKLDRPSKLIIKYDESLLPEVTEDLAAFYYNYQAGWTELSSPSGFIAEGPEVAAEVDHFSLFVVLAKPGAGKQPANIMIQKLTVDPQRILVGQSSDVRVMVVNKGELPGEYAVVVKLDGKVQKTQSVHLNPGQSTEVDMILMPGSSGIYTITAGPMGQELVVDPLIIPDVVETNYWWLLCISAGISTLLFSLIRRQRRNKEAADSNTSQTK